VDQTRLRLRHGVTALDFNYDFKTDLILAGAGGLRLLRQDTGAKFVDVTAGTKLPANILSQPYKGSWAADIDSDGDLDIVLSNDAQTATVLRNNGDGSFTEMHPFNGVFGLRAFVWADVDGDGDPDAAMIGSSEANQAGWNLRLRNERSGQFNTRALPSGLGTIRALSTADLNQDSVLDLIAIKADGAVIQISDKDETQWDVVQIATAVFIIDIPAVDEFNLSVLDLDNNGANDLLLSFGNSPGLFVWLNDKDNKLTPLSKLDAVGSERVLAAADPNNDGRLDLLSITQDGQAIQRINHGKKNYHWQVIRPRGESCWRSAHQ
jgi:hypothetical protein